jgi:hypothetical protein
MTATRSLRTDVRNPVLALPAMRQLLELPAEQRHAIAELLGELAKDCQGRADKAWRKHKAPMAAYWKAAGVYSGHIRRALRAGGGK